MKKPLKILAHYNDYSQNDERRRQNQYGGVGYYRIFKPAEALKKAGHDVRVVGAEILAYGDSVAEMYDNIFKEFDVFYTSYGFSHLQTAVAMYAFAQKHGKKVIIDIDDNCVDILPSHHLYERFRPTKHERGWLQAVLSLADVLAVSTQPLIDRLDGHMKLTQGLSKTFALVPNHNDLADWTPRTSPPRTDGRFVLGYSGSNSHVEDLRMVLPSIRELMAAHPNLHLETLGVLAVKQAPELLRGFTDDMLARISTTGGTDTFRDYPAWLARQRWDAGIAPLADSAFTRCKSHIKWMEYAMCEIPTVASRVYPYAMPCDGKETIRDGETGFLCRDDEWFGAIDRLIKDRELGKRVGKAAKSQVAESWQYGDDKIAANIARALG